MSAPGDPPFDPGVPGASARREHARRRAQRIQLTRDKHRRIGGALVALQEAPAQERSWARGASGEERVARSLAKHLDDRVVLLHDRRIPGSRANIDHIAVGSAGVWVIDAKHYRGKVAVRKPLFGRAKLMIAGRDKTKLVDALARQVAHVGGVIDAVAPEVPVSGALCFVDADLPLLRTLELDGYPLLHPKPLAKCINMPGPLTRERIDAVAVHLGDRFPAA